jgi:tRNA-specific 2-thiouridylase
MNSLGFNKLPSETRVVVAMSGGVDSSVAAALLHEQGYDVIGITLQLYDYGEALAKKGACCAGKDIYDAKRVAEERGFPHYVLNYESNFKESVIENFVASYLKGETPIPCVTCNQTVKFKDLLKVARDLNADCMVTGHYVQRIVNADGMAELHRATDVTKDQSYFLFATTQDQLDYLRFPLGGWSKDVTRQHAERLGLVNATKPDSQDICFVPNGDYASVVTKIAPEAKREGQIVHLDGRILGTHDGIVHYTIGQRKGLGIGGGVTENNEPLYVVGIQADEAKVIVGPKESLARDTVSLKNFNWLITLSKDPVKIDVKLRSMTRALPATLTGRYDGSAEIILDEPQYGVSPGQAAVCYIGGRVIGGGWITGTALSARSNVMAA